MTNAVYAAEDLFSVAWRVERVKDAGTIDRSQSSMVIQPDGSFSTTVGCNQMGGRATVTGNSLLFGPIASTRMACDPALMDLEMKYGIALAATRSFRIKDAVLEFTDESGADLITYRRAP